MLLTRNNLFLILGSSKEMIFRLNLKQKANKSFFRFFGFLLIVYHYV